MTKPIEIKLYDSRTQYTSPFENYEFERFSFIFYAEQVDCPFEFDSIPFIGIERYRRFE